MVRWGWAWGDISGCSFVVVWEVWVVELVYDVEWQLSVARVLMVVMPLVGVVFLVGRWLNPSNDFFTALLTVFLGGV